MKKILTIIRCLTQPIFALRQMPYEYRHNLTIEENTEEFSDLSSTEEENMGINHCLSVDRISNTNPIAKFLDTDENHDFSNFIEDNYESEPTMIKIFDALDEMNKFQNMIIFDLSA